MFTNRQQAAQLLVEKLRVYQGKALIVLAIPRGAVGMGKIIAEALNVPLDILVVRKIGAPANPELAIGAVAPEGTVYWDERLVRRLHSSKRIRDKGLRKKKEEREELEKLLRGEKKYPRLTGKTIVVVDDGVATGATTIAAAMYLKKKKAQKTILATPVIATDTLAKVQKYFDEVVYLEASDDFQAVGQFYEEFGQVSDQEVVTLLSS